MTLEEGHYSKIPVVGSGRVTGTQTMEKEEKNNG